MLISSYAEVKNRQTFFDRLSGAIINEAKQRYAKDPDSHSDQEKGMLFKLLERDERYATVMAFDMIFAGIDNVRSFLQIGLITLGIFSLDYFSAFCNNVLFS